ncbi:MAG: TonB-dependent receptor [Sulfurimonadaceae bacterium]
MKRLVYLSLACAAMLSAAEVELDAIAVESTTLEDVSGEEIKSADVAEALANKVPSVSLVRRSGIANDIILRGQKKDNINVLVDDGKIYGACPNRMDPTTSHIATNNIESIEVTEGPYDVQNFGTLSGAVKITTKQPTEELHGDVNLGYGSFDYKKAAASVSGGVGRFRFLLSMSGETSGQYEDGDGNTFADQIDNAIAAGQAPAATAYQDQYRDMDAYTKLTGTAKIFIDITDDQELRFGYMANRSDDILYPNSKMDALYDDSNLYTAEYVIRDIASFSKELDFQYYYSDVEHPMSTEYRVSSTLPLPQGGVKVSKLTTEMQGIKVINTTDITDNLELKVGLDGSKRNWDGEYTVNDHPATNINPMWSDVSMNDVDTDNIAIFTELDNNFGAWNVKLGLRYDDTTITPASDQQSNDYNTLSANVFSTYNATSNLQFFGGIGKASRVPDARELYFYGLMGNEAGTPDLKQTTNYEVDLGMENKYESFTLKTKLFYSVLKDYIYFNSSNVNGMGQAVNAFENIDATIYGLEIIGSYYALDNLYADFGIAYQRGEKDEPLAGQTDIDLAEIPPLKGNVALNYVYYQESTATVEFVAADTWKNYDADNGEQELASWGVMNLKVDHKFPYGFGLAAGVDNVFDKTYAVSNTYVDLTLLSLGSSDVMLMNEPGRYFYVNASYEF